jgi:hypothetical protein
MSIDRRVLPSPARLVVLAAFAAGLAHAQPPMEPIGATMRFEAFDPLRNQWVTDLPAAPGQTIEWRTVITYTGSINAAALGRVFYQPVIVNADNTDAGDGLDTLGPWRNAGLSGQGNSTLAQGLLSFADGNTTGPIANGYGRVHYGFTSRSTTPGSSGPLIAHRHAPQGVLNEPPIGGQQIQSGFGFMRIAGANSINFYHREVVQCGIVPCFEQLYWGPVADNSAASSTWFAPGTQNLVILRQTLTLSDANTPRDLALTAEAWTLQRAGGGTAAETRFMTWARQGEGGPTATIRVGVEYIPLRIRVTNNYPCNDIDFNNDGYFYDPTDIDAFFSVFAEGPCIPAVATCDPIDFNNDTSAFDPDDIETFFRVFSEGPCLD